MAPHNPSIDDYRLIRPLGRNGATFLAHDGSLDRAVVLSFLPEAEDARRRRLAVAGAFARAAHPNLARVHYVRDTGLRSYVVVAFADGQRLDTLARPLPDARVLDVGRGLAGGLAALHAAGAVHGDVRAEQVVLSDEGSPQLVGLDGARVDADEAAKRADVGALVALLVSIAGVELGVHLSSLAHGEHGVATAEELRRALDALEHPAPATTENPYRGLRAFDREHAAVFCGRQREVAELVERLRGQPWLLISGRSGAGKSSLAQAGVAPAIEQGALGERAQWDIVTMRPGADPVDRLARALAGRPRADRGLLLIVDQLEEAMTLASARERDHFFAALESFGALEPGVRAVFTLRSDFLDRLVDTGSLGRDLVRAAYIVPPMDRQSVREAIVSPARMRGVALETPEMIDALVDELRHHDEALPLLSFALGELWNARDESRRVIPAEALRRLGGAVAALARHGDLVLATLREDERAQARRILLALVTDRATRPTAAELVGGGGAPARAALEALVRGRLVVAGETYDVAHEALARVWPRLRTWLDEASEARAAAARLVAATREWVRLGRSADGLGSERLLQDLTAPGALDGASEDARAFVAASRAALGRARARRRALAIGIPLLLLSLGAAGWTASHLLHRAAVARALAAARALDAKAEETARSAESTRAQAIALFDKDDLVPAEEAWKRMLGLEEGADRERRDVGAALDLALALDARDSGARALYADVTLARFLAAERLHEEALLRELRARLEAYDDGSRAALLGAPAHVRVQTDPAGATLTLARYREDPAGRLVETDRASLATGVVRELEPGSYSIVAEARDRSATRYPFLVRRGEERTLRVVLPRPGDVPAGMVYVPAGRFPYGSSDDEVTRLFFTHQPAHDVEVAAFLIARTEVTNGDYVEFLLALPEAERKARLPNGLALAQGGRIAWRLRERTLAPGEPYCNGVQPCVDWSLLPVEATSREDGERFVAWLAGHLPGARLCTDREWERAARGADDRRYPGGNGDLSPADACTLATYGGDALRAGPCAPGTHAASQSPFGVEDMAGNEAEWTSGPPDVAEPMQAISRGAGWSAFGAYASIANRGVASATTRYASHGLRVCADAK